MANDRPRIVVVGSSNVDLTFRASRLPRVGETLAGQSCQLGFGGKGANQAVMAARLGAAVSMISRVGSDVFGEQTLANYRKEGVDVAHVGVEQDQATGIASIVVDDEARNCILVVPGANALLSPADVHNAAAVIRAADVLLCQLEVPLDAVAAALRLAREAGVRTILNPAPAVALSNEMLALVDLCIPNETEIESLTGQSAGSIEEAAAAAWKLIERGPARVVVTLGERGALLADAQGSAHVPIVPVDAVDPTGAGDAFIGSLAVYGARGKGLYEAVRLASMVAALTVTTAGAQAALPTQEEVEMFSRWVGM